MAVVYIGLLFRELLRRHGLQSNPQPFRLKQAHHRDDLFAVLFHPIREQEQTFGWHTVVILRRAVVHRSGLDYLVQHTQRRLVKNPRPRALELHPSTECHSAYQTRGRGVVPGLPRT